MKKILLLLFLLPVLTYAQKKLSGIGKLQIGASSKVMDTIAKAADVEIGKAAYFSQTSGDYKHNYNYKTTKIVLLQPGIDSVDWVDYNYMDVPGASVYYLNYYEHNGLPLEQAYAYFYNDKLYRLEGKVSTKLVDGLTALYGKGTTTNLSTHLPCTDSDGQKQVLWNQMFKTKWPSPTGIGIEYDHGYYYSSNCNGQELNNLKIQHLKIAGTVLDIALKRKREREQQQATKGK